MPYNQTSLSAELQEKKLRQSTAIENQSIVYVESPLKTKSFRKKYSWATNEYPTVTYPKDINLFSKSSSIPDKLPISSENQKLNEEHNSRNMSDLFPDVDSNIFKDNAIRLGFIRKVYLILSCQLLLTFIFVLAAFCSPNFRDFQNRVPCLVYIFIAITFIIMITMSCFRSVARKVPINYILLSIFTIGEAYIVSFAASKWDAQTVTLAAGLTCLIVVTLTCYAIFTKTDFTVFGGMLVLCGIVLIVGGASGYFFRNKWVNLVISLISVMFFGAHLILNTQLIVGKNERGFAVDDYVQASISIYLDVITIFLHAMRIIGIIDDN